jgi:hypothetical protein
MLLATGVLVWFALSSLKAFFSSPGWGTPSGVLWNVVIAVAFLLAIAVGTLWGWMQSFWRCRFVFDRAAGTLTYHSTTFVTLRGTSLRWPTTVSGTIPLTAIHDAQLDSGLEVGMVRDVNNPRVSRAQAHSVYFVTLRLTDGNSLVIRAPYASGDGSVPQWIRFQINEFLGLRPEGRREAPPHSNSLLPSLGDEVLGQTEPPFSLE